MLTPEHRQESLARAYIHAIAGHLGMSCSVRDFDYGVDLTLHDVRVRTSPRTGNKRYVESGRPLDIQIKSTTNAAIKDDLVKYDLDVEAYNDLREPDLLTPRILVLHFQPREERARLTHTEDALCLRGCCYWICLNGSPAVPNARSKRIEIPRRNVLSVDQLRDMMQRIRIGEPL